MSLNIKNERVHQMAREAAAKTGKSQTKVIEQALERFIEQLDEAESKDERRRRTLAVADEMHDLIIKSGRGPLSTDHLYDENGLPA